MERLRFCCFDPADLGNVYMQGIIVCQALRCRHTSVLWRRLCNSSMDWIETTGFLLGHVCIQHRNRFQKQ